MVDHERIYYRPFRKNFYVEVPEIAKLEQEGKKNFRKVIGFYKIVRFVTETKMMYTFIYI